MTREEITALLERAQEAERRFNEARYAALQRPILDVSEDPELNEEVVAKIFAKLLWDRRYKVKINGEVGVIYPDFVKCFPKPVGERPNLPGPSTLDPECLAEILADISGKWAGDHDLE